MDYSRLILMPALFLASQAYGHIVPYKNDTFVVTVSVTVASNDSAEFFLISGVVDKINVKVLGKTYYLSLQGCIPLRGVRYETVTIYRSAPGSFGLNFNFGTEATPISDLSQASIFYTNGQPVVMSEQDKSGSRTRCTLADKAPNNRIERTHER